MDIAVAGHTSNGAHSKGASKVYYNDRKRFASQYMVVKYLTFSGCHWIWSTDMGGICDKKWDQIYTTEIFTWDKKRSEAAIAYTAGTPTGTKLNFQVRGAAFKSLLSQAV